MFVYSFPGTVGEVTAAESVTLEYCARRIYYNIDSGEIYARFDVRSPIRLWQATRGDTQRVHLYIVNEEQDDNEIIELPAGVEILLEAVSAFGGDPLVSCDTWTEKTDADGYTYYEGILDFDNVALNTALKYGTGTEEDRLDLKADLQITDGAAKISSGRFTLRVNNDAARPEADAPTTLDLRTGYQFKGALSSSSQATSETALAAYATVGLATGVIMVGFLVGLKPQQWILLAGEEADDEGWIKRPADYNGTTNKKYWKKVA